jgi:hypothetical protein
MGSVGQAVSPALVSRAVLGAAAWKGGQQARMPALRIAGKV